MRVTHGKRHTRLYRIWLQMKNRCFNENGERYKDYGARGITVCNEWRNNFQAFYDWSMSNGYSDNLTIDRIDNDKGYSPDNCRWATVKEQNRNSRRCDMISYHGETHCLREWSEVLGISYSALRNRKNYGWSVERMMETPVRKHKRYRNAR